MKNLVRVLKNDYVMVRGKEFEFHLLWILRHVCSGRTLPATPVERAHGFGWWCALCLPGYQRLRLVFYLTFLMSSNNRTLIFPHMYRNYKLMTHGFKSAMMNTVSYWGHTVMIAKTLLGLLFWQVFLECVAQCLWCFWEWRQKASLSFKNKGADVARWP